MTTEISENYNALGRDITDLALGKSRDTVVLAIQMPIAELAHLERLSAAAGKSLSEIVRDAVAAYQAEPVSR